MIKRLTTLSVIIGLSLTPGFSVATSAEELVIDQASEAKNFCRKLRQPIRQGTNRYCSLNHERTNKNSSWPRYVDLSPQPVSKLCGQGSHFVDRWIFDKANIFFEIPTDHAAKKYLPLRLSSTNRECHPYVKITSACYQVQTREHEPSTNDEPVDQFAAVVYALQDNPNTSAQYRDFFVFDRQGNFDYSDQITDSYYLLEINSTKEMELSGLIDEFRCRPGEDLDKCKGNLVLAVERWLDKELRLHVRSRVATSRQRLLEDHAQIEEYLLDLNRYEEILHEKTRLVESGTVSPLVFWDAILGNSGWSFSVQQRDIAVNDGAQQMFSELFHDRAIEGIPQRHSSAFLDNRCLFSPIRYQDFFERAFSFRYHEHLNNHLGKNVSVLAVDYRNWLSLMNDDYEKNFRGREPFDAHPTLAVMLQHIGHWHGPRDGQKVREIVFQSLDNDHSFQAVSCQIVDWLDREAGEQETTQTWYRQRFANTVDGIAYSQIDEFCDAN